jgi:hypothetical protein
MVACGHCGGCCGHCGAICGRCSGASASGIGGAFGGGAFFGGIGYLPYVGGVPFFHHKKRDDTDDAPKVDCDALADPNHPGHREAVTTIAHVDDETHESILRRIKEELEKFESGR